jgi:ABC-type antimicrobial peptide transport system permease subunit
MDSTMLILAIVGGIIGLVVMFFVIWNAINKFRFYHSFGKLGKHAAKELPTRRNGGKNQRYLNGR